VFFVEIWHRKTEVSRKQQGRIVFIVRLLFSTDFYIKRLYKA